QVRHRGIQGVGDPHRKSRMDLHLIPGAVATAEEREAIDAALAATGTELHAPATQHFAPGTKHCAPGTQHPALSTLHRAPSAQHLALSTRSMLLPALHA